MLETLENNPTLRERVLGLTAIGAILIGGAAGVDTMLTSGWQFGGDEASAAPVVYAESQPQYQDDVNQDWSVAPPQRVQLAAQDAAYSVDSNDPHRDLDGANSGAVTPASYAPSPAQQVVAPTASDSESASDQRFQAIEDDVRQANAAVDTDAPKDIVASN